jgi:hypothetical protein
MADPTCWIAAVADHGLGLVEGVHGRADQLPEEAPCSRRVGVEMSNQAAPSVTTTDLAKEQLMSLTGHPLGPPAHNRD